jgi:predicted nucleic acid-binding Zn ribbon protein
VQHIAKALESVLGSGELGDALAGYRAMELWADVVGPTIASHTKPLRCSEGRLVVEVENSVWMHGLSFHRHEILKKLNVRLGREAVTTITLVQAGGRRTSKRGHE